MGVSVLASNRSDGGGAVFTLRFPKALVLPTEEGADAS
jgi:hypothetical protein